MFSLDENQKLDAHMSCAVYNEFKKAQKYGQTTFRNRLRHIGIYDALKY